MLALAKMLEARVHRAHIAGCCFSHTWHVGTFTDLTDSLDRLGADLGSAVIDASAVPWTDDGRTVRLSLADGRDLSGRWLAGPDAAATASKVVDIAHRFAAAAVEVPWPMEMRPIPPAGVWLLSPWLEGQVGAESLDDDGRCRMLADQMAALAGSIAAVDARALSLASTWADQGRLANAVDRWVDKVGPSGIDTAAGDVAAIAAARSVGGSRSHWRMVLSHGDFVPVNVIVRPDGGLALLDLVDAHLAPRLFDLAWWGWVVRFHHPDAWAVGWPVLLAGSGIQRDRDVDHVCTAIGRLRALERAAGASTPADRARWLDRLRATAAW
jgi:aminoglycoside phosphotransferase (APT) family kinase protein